MPKMDNKTGFTFNFLRDYARCWCYNTFLPKEANKETSHFMYYVKVNLWSLIYTYPTYKCPLLQDADWLWARPIVLPKARSSTPQSPKNSEFVIQENWKKDRGRLLNKWFFMRVTQELLQDVVIIGSGAGNTLEDADRIVVVGGSVFCLCQSHYDYIDWILVCKFWILKEILWVF